MNYFNTSLDYSRIIELFDTKTLKNCTVSIVGTGGSTGVIDMLVRSGITHFQLVDPDIVESVNLTNQLYTQRDIKKPKVKATKRMIKGINSQAKVITHHKRYEDLNHNERKFFWQADMVLAMTDNFQVQAQINADAFYWHEIDSHPRQVIFAGNYQDMIAAEIVFLKTRFTSCYQCQAKARYEAFEAGKIETPNGAQSHHLAGQFRNALVAYMTISALHSNEHQFSEIIKGFYEKNMLLAKFSSDFTNDTFANEDIFTIKRYADDDPNCQFCHPIEANEVIFDDHVVDGFVSTIGKHPVETGGILGADLNNTPLHVTRFEFVTAKHSTSTTYTVQAEVMNQIIEDVWMAHDLYLCGIIHSHPGNNSSLSGGQFDGINPPRGDLAMFNSILRSDDAITNGLTTFIAPVLTFSSSGKIKITVWLVNRDHPNLPRKVNAVVLHKNQQIPLDEYLKDIQTQELIS